MVVVVLIASGEELNLSVYQTAFHRIEIANGDGLWKDRGCERSLSFVCRKPCDDNLTDSTTAPTRLPTSDPSTNLSLSSPQLPTAIPTLTPIISSTTQPKTGTSFTNSSTTEEEEVL